MKSLADALVYAVVYINTRTNDDEDEDDADVGALELIAAMLSSATDAEKDALAEATKRALATKQSSRPRPQFIRDYGSWMENHVRWRRMEK